MRRRGEVIPDALLAHLAPLGWQHINLTGDYLWGASSAFGPDGFRPLRRMSGEPPQRDRVPGSPRLPCYPAPSMA